MIRIGFTIGYYNEFTGSQQSLLPLMQETNGIEPILISPSDGEAVSRFEQQGITTKVLPYPDHLDRFGKKLLEDGIVGKSKTVASLLRYYQKVIREYRRLDLDIIYHNDGRSVMLFSIPSSVLGIPAIWYVRGDNPVPVIDPLGLILSDTILTISDGTKERFNRRLVEKFDDKITTLYTGINANSFNLSCQDKNNMESRECLTIVEVASIHPRKGQDILIDAIGHISDELPDYNLILVGSVAEDHEQYGSELINLAKELGIREDVTFLGWTDDVEEVLSRADIFVLPSWSEGLPRSILEASAMGVPTIATPAGGTDELVSDGETGIIVPFGDSQALSSAIERLAKDDEYRENMGKSAKKRVEQKFTQETYVNKFEEIVNKMCQ